MVEIGTLADYAEVFGLVAVVGGALFAWYQIREGRRARAESSALTVLLSFLRDEDFRQAIRTVAGLPRGWHARSDDPDLERNREAAERAYNSLETLGYFTFLGAVQLQHVAQMAGGAIIRLWEVVEPYAQDERKQRGLHAFEWFEWLVDRLHEQKLPQVPAPQAYADWRP